jgi:beta-glucosidase
VADRVEDLLAQMTLEEKASLCSGRDLWHTKGIERLGIASIMMADGPHGLRKQTQSDAVGAASVPSTCFPTGAALASSWDRELIEGVGRALGEECQAEDVQILLGPGVNIKRSPLCGRNFEYLSEDPYLASELATSHVRGVQSQGVGTSVKHFACNNQETLRNSIDAIVDERTLFEIYLPAFEGALVRGGAWTVMSAYNQLNGDFCAESPFLLTDVLRTRWAFDGLVMTDWGGINVRADGLRAGLDLEMPYIGPEHDESIVEAVRNGRLPEAVLDRAVERLLRVILRAAEGRRSGATYDVDAHHALARRVESECIVLAKNEGGVLPLGRSGSVAVLGAFARQPRYQGGGSSHVNPTRLDSPLDALMAALGPGVDLAHADGYSLDGDEPDQALIHEAAGLARSCDTAVVFAGLPDSYESEGFDRTHLSMPASHLRVIEAVLKAQPRTVVVLMNGAPVDMPWYPDAAAVLLCHLGGQAVGGAVADVLSGQVNPSGRLAETYPMALSQTPAFLNFPGGTSEVRYGEGVFVGYRYYEAKGERPRLPFGHGLSYTTFAYEGMALDRTELTDQERLCVTVRVRNTGDRPGREVVQVYVRDPESSVVRPV